MTVAFLKCEVKMKSGSVKKKLFTVYNAGMLSDQTQILACKKEYVYVFKIWYTKTW